MDEKVEKWRRAKIKSAAAELLNQLMKMDPLWWDEFQRSHDADRFLDALKVMASGDWPPHSG